MSTDQQIVVIGGGQAAAQIVTVIRKEGYGGRLVLIADEDELPYQRPPLSKEYLSGKLPRERLTLKPKAAYERADCRLNLGARAAAIDRVNCNIRLSDGEVVAYDKLAIATGAHVRALSVSGSELDGIYYLRTVADVDRIRADMGHCHRIAIVGGGFIGLEAAAVMRQQGKSVTVIEVADRLMPRVVAPVVSDFYRGLHRSHGVDVRLSEAVTDIAGRDGRVTGVVLHSGEHIPADMVIVGIGILPNIDLAEAAGIACDNGIKVDEFARTSDANIVAAGDCAVHFSRRYGRWIRLESVQNAMDQAKTAASTLAGRPIAYDEVPWFWSNQYDRRLQMAGLSIDHDSFVIRGDSGDGQFSVFYFKSGQLCAVDSINRPGDHMAARKLLAFDVEITPDQAGDQSVNLKELLPG